MTTRPALFALLAMWGVATGPLPVRAGDDRDSLLVDKVWVSDGDADRPGVMRIFLSDGTLVEDSCWETYRLSQWQMVGDATMRWTEDGVAIEAEIKSLSTDQLVLVLDLRGGKEERLYRPASVPFVCPDIPNA